MVRRYPLPSITDIYIIANPFPVTYVIINSHRMMFNIKVGPSSLPWYFRDLQWIQLVCIWQRSQLQNCWFVPTSTEQALEEQPHHFQPPSGHDWSQAYDQGRSWKLRWNGDVLLCILLYIQRIVDQLDVYKVKFNTAGQTGVRTKSMAARLLIKKLIEKLPL